MTCAQPPPAAPPLRPKTGPSDGSRIAGQVSEQLREIKPLAQIFEELGFLKMSYAKMSRTIKMVDAPGHVELTGSVLYQESHVTCDEFVRFSDVMLTSTIDDLIAYL